MMRAVPMKHVGVLQLAIRRMSVLEILEVM